MNINEKLLAIQTELKAPKGQYNSFGKYNYRSCEDILEAVKPLCQKNKVVLTIKDDLEYLGNRYYIKATAILGDAESDGMIINTAYAREEESKKGMDGSQITGTASSYARKYALNGLFCIDDTKDADTDEYKKQEEKSNINSKVTEQEAKTIYAIMAKKGLNVIEALKKNYNIESTKDLTKEQYSKILLKMKQLPDKE